MSTPILVDISMLAGVFGIAMVVQAAIAIVTAWVWWRTRK